MLLTFSLKGLYFIYSNDWDKLPDGISHWWLAHRVTDSLFYQVVIYAMVTMVTL